MKYCSLGAVVVVSSFLFSSWCVCVCVCDAFPVLHHWMVLATELDRKWMGFSLQYYWCLVPRARTTIIARVFSLSLRAVFSFSFFFFLVRAPLSSSSQSAGQLLQANEPCNIHLVPHCCFGAAGCQALLLTVPASCAEASGSKKKKWKKQAVCLAKDVVYLSDKPGSCTNVTTPWQWHYFLGLQL